MFLIANYVTKRWTKAKNSVFPHAVHCSRNILESTGQCYGFNNSFRRQVHYAYPQRTRLNRSTCVPQIGLRLCNLAFLTSCC